MCAIDPRERALIHQSGLPEIVCRSILSVKYPVCVRTLSGKFIGSNSAFWQYIKKYNSYEEWFSGFDIDTQVLFQTAEVNAFSAFNGVSIIKSVCFNNLLWNIVIENVEIEDSKLFIWRFYEKHAKNNVFVKGKEFKYMSNKYRFDKIIPYLLGFSHNYSSKIMGVSVDQSKKIFMDFKTFYGFF
ncbi:conjugal transfer protein TrbJ, partial [Salmonella enterica]|nr:conjugal transfer protein TrbJ [Salmonella enterica]